MSGEICACVSFYRQLYISCARLLFEQVRDACVLAPAIHRPVCVELAGNPSYFQIPRPGAIQAGYRAAKQGLDMGNIRNNWENDFHLMPINVSKRGAPEKVI